MAWRENVAFGAGAKIEQLITTVATFTVGTEAANVINVVIQLTGGTYGRDVTRALATKWYLSSDSAGQVPEATGPDRVQIHSTSIL